MDNNYPNSSEGAIQFLTDESKINTKEAFARPDPYVTGVWKVMTPKDQEVKFVVVYLAGYDDPWGNQRTENDFEESYREDA